MITRLLMTITMAALFLQPAWAGFQEGYEAYSRGDYERSLKEWRPLAEQGDAAAQSNIGVMYATGRGVARDDKEAVRWYRVAAAQGHPLGQNNLGSMYDKGRGVPQDYNEALRWYRLAAEQGYANAQLNLGLLYVLGQGTAQDTKQGGSGMRELRHKA